MLDGNPTTHARRVTDPRTFVGGRAEVACVAGIPRPCSVRSASLRSPRSVARPPCRSDSPMPRPPKKLGLRPRCLDDSARPLLPRSICTAASVSLRSTAASTPGHLLRYRFADAPSRLSLCSAETAGSAPAAAQASAAGGRATPRSARLRRLRGAPPATLAGVLAGEKGAGQPRRTPHEKRGHPLLPRSASPGWGVRVGHALPPRRTLVFA